MKRWLMLFAAAATGCIGAFAAEKLEPSADWRQLYYRSNYARWMGRSEQELRAEAKGGSGVASFVLFTKLAATRNPARYAEAEEFEKAAVAAGLPQALHREAGRIQEFADSDIASKLQRLDLYERAAATGYPPAQVSLARALQSGGAIRPDPERAVALARSAADAGLADGMTLLAQMYASGAGEPRGAEDRPVPLLKRAAALGDSLAMGDLGRRHRDGYGVEKDWLKAAAFLTRADPTDFDIGSLGAPGGQRTEEESRFDKILRDFKSALIKRNGEALARIGKMHAEGENGAANPARAAAFFSLAATAGIADAAAKRDELAKTLSAEQREAMKADLKWMTEFRPMAGGFVFPE